MNDRPLDFRVPTMATGRFQGLDATAGLPLAATGIPKIQPVPRNPRGPCFEANQSPAMDMLEATQSEAFLLPDDPFQRATTHQANSVSQDRRGPHSKSNNPNAMLEAPKPEAFPQPYDPFQRATIHQANSVSRDVRAPHSKSNNPNAMPKVPEPKAFLLPDTPILHNAGTSTRPARPKYPPPPPCIPSTKEPRGPYSKAPKPPATSMIDMCQKKASYMSHALIFCQTGTLHRAARPTSTFSTSCIPSTKECSACWRWG